MTNAVFIWLMALLPVLRLLDPFHSLAGNGWQRRIKGPLYPVNPSTPIPAAEYGVFFKSSPTAHCQGR